MREILVGGIVHPDDLGDFSMRPGLSDGLCAHRRCIVSSLVGRIYNSIGGVLV